MYFYTIRKILFFNIILCSFVQASQGNKKYYYNQFVNYNDEYILYSITDASDIRTSKSVTLKAFDLKSKRNLPVHCHIKEGHFFKVRLFFGPAIKFIAAPILYKEEDARLKDGTEERLYVPVATEKEVFLAEINKNKESLHLELVEKINTHNSPIYSLHSFSTTSMQSVISSSLYPSIKIWVYDNTIKINNTHNLVGGVVFLSQIDNFSHVYILKDETKETMWQRWFYREKMYQDYTLCHAAFQFSNAFKDLEISKVYRMSLDTKNSLREVKLTDKFIFSNIAYSKNTLTNKEDLIGLFLHKDALYLCSKNSLKKIINFAIQNINQLFFVTTSQEKSIENIYYLLFLTDKGLIVKTYSKLNIKTDTPFDEWHSEKLGVDFVKNNQKIIGGCLSKDNNGLHILSMNGNSDNIEYAFLSFDGLLKQLS